MAIEGKRAWYAVSTASGFEDKVVASIKQRINSLELSGKVFDAFVPKEKRIEIKNGKRKIVDQKIFQGYVLVEMAMGDEAWYVVRNTQGVTGFVGAGTVPSPVSNAEIAKIKKRMGVDEPKYSTNFMENEVVSVIDGPFKGFDGMISAIDSDKGKLTVLVSMFGRETPVELDVLQVKKLQ
ncbi:transcription termination/antitermination protein NusG [Candidatus Saccharibacteria bacterium]|nr:transcription termination/antitermination protein NusG [Candidatus Saccharibacteria bacterium]